MDACVTIAWETVSPKKLYWLTERIQNFNGLMSVDSDPEPKHSSVAYFMLTVSD